MVGLKQSGKQKEMHFLGLIFLVNYITEQHYKTKVYLLLK